MKKIITLIVIALSLGLSSCSKDDLGVEVKTYLDIYVKDNLGNPVQGAEVKLYSSETDWKNGSNQVGAAQYSNAEGKAVFEGVSNIKYYWLATKDCNNNVNGSVTTASPLNKGERNSVNTILTSTGNMRLNSTSSNPYRIYINGNAVLDMQGGSVQYWNYLPVGTYTVRVLQLSGYVLYPTDKTYSVNITCGYTTAVTFP